MSGQLKEATAKLEQILEGKVDRAHGIDHAVSVLGHAEGAIEHHPGELTEQQKLAIKLAALLHDADDGKFFKDSRNAEEILKSIVDEPTRELTMKLINLVSCSKNGNSKAEEEWMLYPRYADRLEAIGEIGIWRCWQYTLHVKRPAYTIETERAQSLEELHRIASKERFEYYVSKQGKVGSSSFIDHFYDKLLHISDLGENPYFVKEAARRHKVMEEFLLDFGRQGEINHALIKEKS